MLDEAAAAVMGEPAGSVVEDPPLLLLLLSNMSSGNASSNASDHQGLLDGGDRGQPLYVTVIIVLMYTLIIIVSLGGNILVCYIILSRAAMRTVTNLFLLNLAVSDIMKAVICNPFTFVANLILLWWPFGEFMCPFVTYVQVVAVFLSAFTLVAISLDRFVAIVYPLRRRTTRRTFLKVAALIWFLSLAVPLPTAIVSRVQYDGNDTTDGLCWEVWERDSDKYIYSIILMMLQYFIPLTVITFSNAKIGYIIWIKKTPGEAERDRDRRIASSKRRVSIMIQCPRSGFVVIMTRRDETRRDETDHRPDQTRQDDKMRSHPIPSHPIRSDNI